MEKTTSLSPNWALQGLLGDIAAASISTILVSPTITIIDRALVEKASYHKPVLQGLRAHTKAALKHPASFLFSRPHGHVFALYAATYTVANTTETVTKQTHPSLSDAITFACTFLVNVPLGVWKDIRFAHFFGTNPANPANPAKPHIDTLKSTANPLPIPKKTGSAAATTTLLVRDAITIYGSFTLAQQCAAIIPDSLASHPYSKTVFTQLLVPVVSQLFATPLHLLGLDLYNRQYRVPVRDRVKVVLRDLPVATMIRGVRIIPAFGVGCLVNMGLREAFIGFECL